MSKPIVIEVGGEPLGVVIRNGELYRFLAVKLPAFAVDGHSFKSVEDARRAVSRTVAPQETEQDGRCAAAEVFFPSAPLRPSSLDCLKPAARITGHARVNPGWPVCGDS